MELQVERLSESDSYRGIVRVSKDALNRIGISPGNYIIIAGKRETCTKVWTTSAKSKTVWMDDIMGFSGHLIRHMSALGHITLRGLVPIRGNPQAPHPKVQNGYNVSILNESTFTFHQPVPIGR